MDVIDISPSRKAMVNRVVLGLGTPHLALHLQLSSSVRHASEPAWKLEFSDPLLFVEAGKIVRFRGLDRPAGTDGVAVVATHTAGEVLLHPRFQIVLWAIELQHIGGANHGADLAPVTDRQIDRYSVKDRLARIVPDGNVIWRDCGFLCDILFHGRYP